MLLSHNFFAKLLTLETIFIESFLKLPYLELKQWITFLKKMCISCYVIADDKLNDTERALLANCSLMIHLKSKCTIFVSKYWPELVFLLNKSY